MRGFRYAAYQAGRPRPALKVRLTTGAVEYLDGLTLGLVRFAGRRGDISACSMGTRHRTQLDQGHQLRAIGGCRSHDDGIEGRDPCAKRKRVEQLRVARRRTRGRRRRSRRQSSGSRGGGTHNRRWSELRRPVGRRRTTTSRCQDNASHRQEPAQLVNQTISTFLKREGRILRKNSSERASSRDSLATRCRVLSRTRSP